MDAIELSWIPTAYLLATAIVLVPAGKIADMYGRKKIFATGLAVYTLASTLGALAPSAQWLIALRVGQGAGAAMFVTTGMAIITSIFPPRRRGRAIGIYVAAVYIGLSVGPFVGGLMTQHYGIASGAVATMRLLGQMSSMALAAVVLAIFVGREAIQPSNYPLFLKSVRLVFALSAGLCAIGIFFSYSRGNLRASPEGASKI